MKNKAQQN